MNTPICSRPSSHFRSSNSRPAKYGTKLFLGGTVLLLSLLVLGSSAFAQNRLSPDTLSFGNQAVGVASVPKTATLKNAQAGPLTITTIVISGGNAPADYAWGGNCPISPNTLGAGLSCSITVTFTPSALGSRTASLTVTASAPISPPSITLRGTGVAPVTLSPASLGFGNQVAGTTSAAKTETLKNVQTVPLTITGIAVSGPFVQTGGTCPLSPATLAGGGSCTILVSFAPTAVGPAVGTLTVTDNAALSPQTAGLTGTGTTPVTLSPRTLHLGSVAVGNTSASKSITLTNHENVALNFSSITTTGDFAVASNTCGASVGGGTTCTVGITFSPTAIGARTGTLTFADDAVNSPQIATLTGTGTAPVTLSTSSLTFAARSVGTTSAVHNVTLTNHLTGPVAIYSVLVNGDFAVANNTCGSSVAAGVACEIGVTFTPTAVGTRTGTLTINDSAFGSPLLVSLTGTGNDSGLVSITVTPANPSLPLGLLNNLPQSAHLTVPARPDLTTSVTWSSLPRTVATINASGLASSAWQGSATITATLNAIKGSTTLTVTAPVLVSIAVTPANPSIACRGPRSSSRPREPTATGARRI